ncbi:hypothetical protein [Polyangium mundeleinium]|uniref:Uncharacterized protein n=1 Tax=Polyangium mundeleinium TaxID=2995306 RepID=A0ABT5EP64_9BACT|nr:hypothetical protein [Polyangium mundeleinium]MDC0743114.1 hypothetical protein [Polyangium mundeleinium]
MGGGCVATDPGAIEGRGARRAPRARRPQLVGLGLDVGLVLVGLVHRGGRRAASVEIFPEVSRP